MLDFPILLHHSAVKSFPKEKYTLQSVNSTVRFNFAIILQWFLEIHGQLWCIVNRSCIRSPFFPWINRVFFILTSSVGQFGKASTNFRTTLLLILYSTDMTWNHCNTRYFESFMEYRIFIIISFHFSMISFDFAQQDGRICWMVMFEDCLLLSRWLESS